jgi:hypothetical protein
MVAVKYTPMYHEPRDPKQHEERRLRNRSGANYIGDHWSAGHHASLSNLEIPCRR